MTSLCYSSTMEITGWKWITQSPKVKPLMLLVSMDGGNRLQSGNMFAHLPSQKEKIQAAQDQILGFLP